MKKALFLSVVLAAVSASEASAQFVRRGGFGGPAMVRPPMMYRAPTFRPPVMAPMQRPPMQMARPVIRPPQYAFRPRVQGNSGYYTQPRVVPGMNLPGPREGWVGGINAATSLIPAPPLARVPGAMGKIAPMAGGAAAQFGQAWVPTPGDSAYDAMTGTRYYQPRGFSTQTTTPYMLIPKP